MCLRAIRLRTYKPPTSVVDNLGAQNGSHLQHSDEGLVHGGEGERGHAVPPGHLGDVHRTVTWKHTRNITLLNAHRPLLCCSRVSLI